MTEDDRALFRAEMFERAARAMLGLPVEPVEVAGEEQDNRIEEGRDDDN